MNFTKIFILLPFQYMYARIYQEKYSKMLPINQNSLIKYTLNARISQTSHYA